MQWHEIVMMKIVQIIIIQNYIMQIHKLSFIRVNCTKHTK